MTTQFIRPSGDPAHRVLHPHGRELAAAGETVEWSSYWQRHLKAGAIVLGPAPSAAPRPVIDTKEG
jgi:hypothetical protein